MLQDPKPAAAGASPQPRGRSRSVKSTRLNTPPVDEAGKLGTSRSHAQDLVTRLGRVDLSGASLTPETADRWRGEFQQLVQQGPSALPAIREYLMSFADVSFGSAGLRQLGHASARTSLIGALAEIGGPEALALTLEMLRLTAEPPEIALLAANLERLAPDQAHWRGEATQAAREALALAACRPPGDQDVAPLFEVLNRYGGASAVPHLELVSGNWNYYASMALAELPDGAGVSSLVRMAQEQKGTIPFQMLVQLAPENAKARTALLEMAKTKTIPDSAWPHLQSVLQGQRFHFADSVFDESGDTATHHGMNMVHIAKGNQNYYMATDANRLSKEHLDQQTALVNDLAAVVQGPTATKVLEAAKTALTAARPAPDGAEHFGETSP